LIVPPPTTQPLATLPVETTAATGAAAPVKGVSLGRDAWRRLRKNRTAMVALVFLYVIASIFIIGGELNASIHRFREMQRMRATVSPDEG